MRLGIIALLIAYGGAFAQTASKKVASPANLLFTVRNSPVTTDEFVYLYKKNHTKPEEFKEEQINEYLNLLINFKLKIAEAKSRGLDTTQAFIKEFNTYKEELKKPYRAGSDDLDRLTHEVYDRLGWEIKAAHILISVKQDASPADTLLAYQKILSLRQRAEKGEDFEKLAREYSEDPSAKSNNGNLGYFTALQMVYPFEDAAFKTDPGKISPVIRTRFGYHILKVIDRRKAQGEVEVSHILLRTTKDNASKVKNTAFEIYDQLKGGRKWDDLCKEYSEDTNTKNTGGRLKPFSVGAMSPIPEFEQVAFSLKTPGEYSDPFQTNIGWHIIRLEKKIPLPSYKEMEVSLKRKVARDERLAVSKSNALEKKKKELGFSEISEVKTWLVGVADSSLVQGRWKYTGPDSLLARTIILWSSNRTPVRDVVQFVSVQKTKSSLSPAAYMKQLYDRYVEAKVNELEDQKLTAENPEFGLLLNEYKEGILLFEIMEKEVWNKASEDTTGQRKFYNGHTTQFMAGNRIEARLFATPDRDFLSEIKKKIEAGDTLKESDIKKFKSVTNWKTYERSDSQVIDRINWVPGLQETELNGTLYLVEVSRLVAPGLKTFEESRAAVISAYQESLEKDWLKGLRQKYPVHINKKGKTAVIAALKK